MKPLLFRKNIQYQLIHLESSNIFSQEEADEFMSDNHPPNIMMVIEGLVHGIDDIIKANPDKRESDLDMLSLIIDKTSHIVKIRYRFS